MMMGAEATKHSKSNTFYSTPEMLAGLQIRSELVEEQKRQNVLLLQKKWPLTQEFQYIQRKIKRLALDSALINAEIGALKGQEVEGILQNIKKTLLDETPDFDVDRMWLVQKMDDIREIAVYGG